MKYKAIRLGHWRSTRNCDLIKTLLLKACNAFLGHIEKRYALPGFHLDFSKKVRTTKLNGLFMKDGKRGILEEKNLYAVDIVFQLVAALIDKKLGFEAQCEVTRINLKYFFIVNKTLVDH